ncbi:ABI gene family member 3 [Podarcis raffonei]|uniref:ABI gene family member 3 n=1 Tax=Podarcis raffonei TaxID=65483 RepID=UPI0023299D3E|nr:ABI gene family member 3 [Podarcis raffonei]
MGGNSSTKRVHQPSCEVQNLSAAETVRSEKEVGSRDMSELQQLMQNAIPSARGTLKDNYSNLLKVADYCESNYEEAKDKRKALEETMAFATQSLASVAYQISNLASDILKTMDLQLAEVRQVEAKVCSIAQVVEMHMEKVSRREIGALSVCKRFPHQQKIIPPSHVEPLEAYYRKPLNFNSLDDIGHGIKDHGTQLAKTGTLCRRGNATSSGQSSGSLRRSQRIPEPIRPPVVPEGKPSSSASSLSSLSPTEAMEKTGMIASTEPPPPPTLSPFPPPAEASDVLPPPLPEDLLPPPPPFAVSDVTPDLDFPMTSPPLDASNLEQLVPPLLPPPPPPEKLPWAPDTYLEKVVTLYPYTQQQEQELSFAEGTVIYVTRRYSDGWCEGVTSDAKGLFPGNYAEPLP